MSDIEFLVVAVSLIVSMLVVLLIVGISVWIGVSESS